MPRWRNSAPRPTNAASARPQVRGCDIGAIESESGRAETGRRSDRCTLADQIRAANTNRPVGYCPAGTEHDTIEITRRLTLSEPLPPITGTITIEGHGRIIKGADRFRVFDVAGGSLTIKNLVITNANSPGDYGGAIRVRNGGALTLDDVYIQLSNARWGGAVASIGSSRLRISDSKFVSNVASERGGAIYINGGSAEIRRSSFYDNSSLGDRWRPGRRGWRSERSQQHIQRESFGHGRRHSYHRARTRPCHACHHDRQRGGPQRRAGTASQRRRAAPAQQHHRRAYAAPGMRRRAHAECRQSD